MNSERNEEKKDFWTRADKENACNTELAAGSPAIRNTPLKNSSTLRQRLRETLSSATPRLLLSEELLIDSFGSGEESMLLTPSSIIATDPRSPIPRGSEKYSARKSRAEELVSLRSQTKKNSQKRVDRPSTSWVEPAVQSESEPCGLSGYKKHDNTSSGVRVDLCDLFYGSTTSVPSRKNSPQFKASSTNSTSAQNETSGQPSAIHNNFNEDRWVEQQSKTFTSFLNNTLAPKQVITTTALRLYARALAEARVLFKNQIHLREILWSEISKGRVSVRSDRNIAADVLLRETLIGRFLDTIQTPWLRLGLETLFQLDMIQHYRIKSSISVSLLFKYTRDETTFL